MNNVVTYSVKLDTGESLSSLNELESSLEKYNQQLKESAVGSDEFNAAQKNVRKLTGEIEHLNKAVTGITLEDKIQTMDGALKTLAGSTQAVVGGLGLMGIESEKFKKFEESAASAIAFGMGIKDLSEGIGQLARSQAVSTAATKVATIAQKAWNAIITMNPLGILITGLTVAGGLIYAFRDKILNLIKTALGPFQGIIDTISNGISSLGEKLGIVDDARTKQIKANIKALENQVQLDEAAGKSSLVTQKRLLAEKRKLLEKGSEEYAASLQEEKVLNTKINKEKADADKAASEKAKELKDKNDEKEKTRLEAYKTLLKKYKDEEQDIIAKTEQQKLDLEKQRGLAEIDALKLTESEKVKLKEQFNKVYALKQKELNDNLKKIDDEKKKENKKREEDLTNELTTLQASRTQTLLDDADAEVNATKVKYQRLIEEAIANNQSTQLLEQLQQETISKIKTDAQTAESERLKGISDKQKQDLLDNVQAELDAAQDKIAIRGMIVDAIMQLADQETAVGKAAFVAQQILRLQDLKATATAALKKLAIDQSKAGAATAQGFAETAKVGFPQNVPLLIAYGLQAAAIISSMSSAFSTAKSAAASVGAGGASGGTMESISIPQTPVAQTPLGTQIQANQATQQGQQTVQAYVISGNVTSAQEADAKIRMRRTVGA